MFCSREYQPTSRLNKQNEKSTSNYCYLCLPYCGLHESPQLFLPPSGKAAFGSLMFQWCCLWTRIWGTSFLAACEKISLSHPDDCFICSCRCSPEVMLVLCMCIAQTSDTTFALIKNRLCTGGTNLLLYVG